MIYIKAIIVIPQLHVLVKEKMVKAIHAMICININDGKNTFYLLEKVPHMLLMTLLNSIALGRYKVLNIYLPGKQFLLLNRIYIHYVTSKANLGQINKNGKMVNAFIIAVLFHSNLIFFITAVLCKWTHIDN